MKTIYSLALALPLLLACCKDDDCDSGTGSVNHDQPYKFKIGFYMTDAATGQPLIQDSLAPYRPDSVSVRQFNGTTIYPRLGYYGGSQYGYLAPPGSLAAPNLITQHPSTIQPTSTSGLPTTIPTR